LPLLKKYELPVTVYQTTYYSDHAFPIFNLICSYMLWNRRTEQLLPIPEIGLTGTMDLRTQMGRHRVVRSLIGHSEREGLSGTQKNEIAARLASALRIDYAALNGKRILQLMNPNEISDIAKNGVDVQLHTHRHRTPEDEALFRREIVDNRQRIQSITGKVPRHFCYPSGVHRKDFLSWLEKENVQSATTCDVGLARSEDNPLLLSRFVDTAGRTQMEFESWLAGVGDMIAFRRITPQQYVVPED